MMRVVRERWTATSRATTSRRGCWRSSTRSHDIQAARRLSFFRRPAGLTSARGAARHGHRRGQPRQRHAYAVDAHGLRAKSTTDNLRKELKVFAEERLVQNATGVTRTEQPLRMSMERVEDMLQLDSRAGLARLSEDTGGFLVEGSNNSSSAFRRIDEDNQFHYLLTYAPKNSAFDGKFREIQVKVRRPGVQVFARKGYRALSCRRPAMPTTSTCRRSRCSTATPLPNAFPIHAAGFSFPDAGASGPDAGARSRRHRRRCASSRRRAAHLLGAGSDRRAASATATGTTSRR